MVVAACYRPVSSRTISYDRDAAVVIRAGRAGNMAAVRVRVGCEFHYVTEGPVPTIWQVRPRPDGDHRVVSATWEVSPEAPVRTYLDGFGNLCDRLILGAGTTQVRYDAVVAVPSTFDEADKGAAQVPVEALPDDVLVHLLPSRLCPSELLCQQAWDLFGSTAPGWQRVQAVCDWVHESITFRYGTSRPHTTAADVLEAGTGVCRDFTHLAITFCRGLNVPARYVFGYLPDIGVPPPDEPMDFCAWFEAWLDGRWWTFDPRNNVPRTGRVVIGRGRDAVDVAMVTNFGAADLRQMTVWADEA